MAVMCNLLHRGDFQLSMINSSSRLNKETIDHHSILVNSWLVKIRAWPEERKGTLGFKYSIDNTRNDTNVRTSDKKREVRRNCFMAFEKGKFDSVLYPVVILCLFSNSVDPAKSRSWLGPDNFVDGDFLLQSMSEPSRIGGSLTAAEDNKLYKFGIGYSGSFGKGHTLQCRGIGLLKNKRVGMPLALCLHLVKSNGRDTCRGEASGISSS
jgi:hypothetical protein